MFTPGVYRGVREGLSDRGSRFGSVADGFDRKGWLCSFLLLRAREGGVLGGELAAGLEEEGWGSRSGIYDVIRAMEGEGMLTSSHDGPAGEKSPWARYYYATTELGEAYLESRAGLLEHERGDVHLFLEVYRARGKAKRDPRGGRG